MICRKCGREIEGNARECSYCGTPVKRRKPVYKKWWFWVLMGLATIITLAAVGGSEEGETSGTDTPSTPSSSIVSEEKVYEVVDLRKMIDELDENALKAERTYQDKYVEVVGVITNFDSDGSYISIEPVNADAWDFTSVTCDISNDEQLDFLLEKSVGDKITIKGQVTSIGEILGYSIEIDEVY